jgi:hypothetical protein
MQSTNKAYSLIKSLEGTSFKRAFLIHLMFATAGAMVVGFIPEAFASRTYLNSGLEAFSPMIFAVAGILGTIINKEAGNKAAMWVWVAGTAWLCLEMYNESRSWDFGRAHSRAEYIVNNFFGPTSKCSATECLSELFAKTPFASTVGYSIGGVIGYIERLRRKPNFTFPEPSRTENAKTEIRKAASDSTSHYVSPFRVAAVCVVLLLFGLLYLSIHQRQGAGVGSNRALVTMACEIFAVAAFGATALSVRKPKISFWVVLVVVLCVGLIALAYWWRGI